MAKEIGQAFGGIGDAVSGVLKGVGDAVSNAVKGVGDFAKDIYESPIGRALIIAGAVYFGGAALAGGFGSAGAGGSFLSGMGSGINASIQAMADAWAQTSLGPLGSAWGSAYQAGVGTASTAAQLGAAAAMDGGADALATAAESGGGGAPTALAPPPAPVPASVPAAPLAPAPAAAGSPTAYSFGSGGATLPPPPETPWYSKALDYITPKSELAKYGLISGATQVVGNVIQGLGQEQAAKEQREYEAEQLRKAQELRNANVGAELFAPGQYMPAPAAAPAAMPGAMPMRTQVPGGLARRYMPSPYTRYGV